ncbi:MAG TPA: hypothetical protein PLV92_26400, partial [Pirellulaceae bacterium]|nr:hypothetical protein [Pirellulaceae bacterium]
PRRVWCGPNGDERLESYTITGMSHGAALDPGPEPHQCGTAAPFFNAVGISSTHRIADFWGLLDTQAAAAAEPATFRPTDEGLVQHCSERAIDAGPDAGTTGAEPKTERYASADAASPNGDAQRARGASGTRPFGLDVHGIISASLEAAGLLKPGDRSRRSGSSVPLGIDVPGIISTALEAAGVLKGIADRAAGTSATATWKTGGWDGSGWELLVGDARAFRGGSILYGCASSGDEGAIGPRAHSISRRFSLGARPELSYVRRLDLSAAVNDHTSASFRVLVDGVVVDEVTAIGMVHRETEWLRQSAIDLRRFADRTVTLTLEVAACSNLYSPVYAKAWIDEITLHNAVETVSC